MSNTKEIEQRKTRKRWSMQSSMKIQSMVKKRSCNEYKMGRIATQSRLIARQCLECPSFLRMDTGLRPVSQQQTMGHETIYAYSLFCYFLKRPR